MSHRLPFHEVAAEEMSLVRRRREKLGGLEPETPAVSGLDGDLADRIGRASHDDARLKACRLESLDRHHAALAFSGGGIRAATFALGVVQGMASLGLLRRFDYLSTVSGGGYAGAWLAAWIKRDGDPANVEAQLSPGRVANARAVRDDWGELLPRGEVIDEEPEPVYHLREYSSYLTPRPGLLSADTWAILAIWLRNVMINLLVLLPATVLVVVLARFAVYLHATLWLNLRGDDDPSWAAGAVFAAGLMLVAWSFTVNSLAVGNFRRRSMLGRERLRGWYVGPKQALYAIVWPLMIAAVLLTISFRQMMPWLDRRSIVRWAMATSSLSEVLEVDGLIRVILDHAILFALMVGVLTLGVGLAFGTFRWRHLRAAMLGGASAGLLGVACEVIVGRLQHAGHAELAASLMPAMAILVVVLALFIEVALLGRTIEEAEREWWGRLTGMLLRAAAGWVVAMASILFIPLGFLYAENSLARAAITAGWVGTTASGVLAARSVMSGLKSEGASRRLAWLVGIAPPIFLVGLLGGCSLLTAALLREVRDPAGVVSGVANAQGGTPDWRDYLQGLTREDNLVPLLQMASFAFLAGSIGLYLIDVNLFSLNAMYANRLTRAYLGASRPKRRWDGRWGPRRDRFEGGGGPVRAAAPPRDENPVTGFDADDDIPLMDLKIGATTAGPAYWGPHLLINTSLNMVGGGELAWRNRQCESFTLTPVFCGSKGTGFARLAVESHSGKLIDRRMDLATRRDRLGRSKQLLMGCRRDHRERLSALDPDDAAGRAALDAEWADLEARRARLLRREEVLAREQMRLDRKVDAKQLTLGRAIAISGAAVDPNMNAYQSPALTALLTVFNARLGYWLQNPFHPGWAAKGPIYGSLLRDEFFGETDDKGKFIHLTDGGHFENLGVYELIRRRCRYVVVCDAGEDGSPADENLANLVRLCRTDFGVRIQVDTTPLRRTGPDGLTPVHVAIGRICYDDVDRGEMLGILVYLKISMTGDEPADMRNYAALHPDFPHQATDLRQAFDEAQFESYRTLGEHIARVVFENAVDSLAAAGHPVDAVAPAGTPADAFHRDYIRGNQRLFSAVRNRWVDPSPVQGGVVAALTRDYLDLQRQLRQDPRLADLSGEIYHELSHSIADRDRDRDPGIPPAERRRAELHAVGQMLQVMENAWADLGMKGHDDLPVNRGWMNVFHRWAGTATFHRLWPSLRPEYSPEFVRFCEGRLHLVAARPTLRRVAAFEPGRLDQDDDHGRDAPRPHTLDYEIASIRRLAREFDREWPTEAARERGIIPLIHAADDLRRSLISKRSLANGNGHVHACNGCLEQPLVWLIWQGAFGEPDARPFACGIILARPWEMGATRGDGPPSYEVLAWVRPAYRSIGLGSACFKPAIDELCSILGRGRLRIRYPHWDRGSGDVNNRAAWRGFFSLYNFKDVKGRDNDLKGDNTDGIAEEFDRDMILEYAFEAASTLPPQGALLASTGGGIASGGVATSGPSA